MQSMTLRRYYLPQADDSAESLAAALWLSKQDQEALKTAVLHGIVTAFTGES